MAAEDPFDRAGARRRRTAFGFELATNGSCAALTQSGMPLKPVPQCHNPALQAGGSTIGRAGETTRAIRPIDSLQPFTRRPMKPAMNCTETNPKASGHRAKRRTAPQCGDNQPPFGDNFFSGIGQHAPKSTRRTDWFNRVCGLLSSGSLRSPSLSSPHTPSIHFAAKLFFERCR